ncbi:MAG: hypothetical protein A2033_04980 [Bacteroidetes bacterium GWA2_31_9]|nr:MAG: hypothetical protein A2033_04980 [Bacteroidetes bacterium GWA2_31_9]
MIRIIRLIFIFTLSIAITSYSGFSQVSQGESEQKTKAEDYFKNQEYSKALPIYSQLLSLYPSDPTYNYKYGVCLVETNSQTSSAIKYLTLASTKNVNSNTYFYLGKAYHLNYKFDEAIKNYNKFKQVGSKTDVKSFQPDRYIEMCNNGKELIRYISDLMVLENKKLKNEDFYMSYDIKDFGGRILFLSPDFKSNIDKSEKAPLLMFLSEKLNVIYYASYGKSNKTGTDIYRKKRIEDGSWGEAENLGLVINTPYDENYPYIHSDGVTLYFCSKGHNSMGGYDVFRSVYDESTNTWSEPVNLDFPTNTPYDDIMFATDPKEEIAYFASNRETGSEKISVYKIKVDKNPIEKEYLDLEEIIEKSKLEVSPIVATLNASENNLKMTSTNLDTEVKTNNLNSDAFTFTEMKSSPTITNEQIADEVKNDASRIRAESKNIRRDANYAYVTSKNKLRNASDKRKQSQSIISSLNYISNPSDKENKRKKAKELEDEANILDKQAVVTYNVAKNLEKVANDKDNEAKEVDELYKKLLTNKTMTSSEMIAEVNKNKKKLNQGQNKFTTFDNEVSKRRKLVETKSKELETSLANVKKKTAEVDNTDKEISNLRKDVNDPANATFKEKLQSQLIAKTTDYNTKKEEEAVLIAQSQKLTLEVENLNNEVVFLKSLSEEISTTNSQLNTTADQIAEVDKTQLEKEVYEKEFTVDKNYTAEVKTAQTEKDINKLESKSSEVLAESKNTVNKEENTQDLYNQAKRNEQVADSMQILINSKKTELNKMPESSEKEKLQKEISELEYLAEIKKQQSDRNFAMAVQSEKNNNNTSENVAYNEKTFPFAGNENSNNPQEQYDKEVFKAQYYENIADGYQKNIDILKTGLDTVSNPELKKAIQDNIKQLEANVSSNKDLAEASTKNAESIKSNESSNISENKLSETELLVMATNYISENEIPLDDKQKIQLETAPNDKLFADKSYNSWIEQKTTAEKLYNQAKNSRNPKEKAKQIAEADAIFAKAQTDFQMYDETYALVNKEEYEVLDEVLEKHSFVANSDDVKLANSLENEAKIYFNKASTIRKNAPSIESYNTRATELEKAKGLEQISISKQKNAIDLYLKSTKDGVKPEIKPLYATNKINENKAINNNTENNSNNEIANSSQNQNSVTDNSSKNTSPEITLLYEEEVGLQKFREQDYIATTLIESANKQIEEIDILKEKAKVLNNPKERAKQLAELSEKENKAKLELVKAYKQFGIADSIKYDIYKNQLSLMIDSLYEVENNTIIAKQYIKEADIYFSEALKLRNQESALPSVQQKVDNLKKATEFEKKALDNQEVALNSMIEIDPIVFATNNSLVKVDVLELLNKPVYVAHLKSEREKLVLDKIKLTKDDVEAFDAARLKLNEADEQMKEANTDLAKAQELRTKAETVTSDKDKKEAIREAEKSEKKSLDLQIKASENYELVNNTKFSIYEDYVKPVRLKDNSNKARQGKQLEKDANVHFSKAKKLRDKYYTDKKPSVALLAEADSLEKVAIDEMELAYGIYLNIPTVEQLAQNDTSITKSSSINKDIVIKTKADITPVNNNDTTKIIAQNNTEKPNNNKIEKVVKDNNTNIVIGENLVNENKTEGTITSNQTKQVKNDIVVNSNDKDFVFGFALKGSCPYSNSNPIPMNVKLPDCIVFKVQVGAFVNPIEQNAFKGLYPVTGEKLPNSKYAKYFVGMFRSEEATRMVLSEVKKMGYPDAFIVAYLDGNKVSPTQASNIIKAGTDNCVAGYSQMATNEVQMVKSQTTTGSDVALSVNTNIKTQSISETVGRTEVNATDIKNVDGLLYSVQIGVFKTLPTADKIHNLNPIYKEQTESGFIRLTTGVFDNYEAARSEKNKIVGIGIDDAFVVAYQNGKRLNLDEAKRMEKGSTKKASTSSINIPNSNNSSSTDNSEIVFKVQVGAYEKQVPTNVVSSLLKIASMKDFEQKANEKGVTLYTVGKFKTYEEAVQTKNIVVNSGVPDAFVIAFKGNKQISIDEAKQLLKK